MGTRGEWAKDFAKALGNTSPSADIVNWISAWTKNENTKARFNPLATTLDYGKTTDFNSVGVKNYETREQGIEATVKTVSNFKYPGYKDIVDGILENDVRKSAAGLIRAPWGSNGAMVQNIAATLDVRNEPLLAESGSGKTGSNDKPDTSPLPPSANHGEDAGRGHYQPNIGGHVDISGAPASYPDLDNGKRIMYIGGGILALFIAGMLAIRTYVPTQQIVRTIAEVAA